MQELSWGCGLCAGVGGVACVQELRVWLVCRSSGCGLCAGGEKACDGTGLLLTEPQGQHHTGPGPTSWLGDEEGQ